MGARLGREANKVRAVHFDSFKSIRNHRRSQPFVIDEIRSRITRQTPGMVELKREQGTANQVMTAGVADRAQAKITPP
jgi:hypothetical protein